MARRTEGSREHVAPAGKRVFLAFVCLVIAPIAGIWVGVKFPNPPGNGPGVWQVIFGGGVPVALALGAAALTRVRRPEAVCWVLAAIVATLGLLLLAASIAASID